MAGRFCDYIIALHSGEIAAHQSSAEVQRPAPLLGNVSCGLALCTAASTPDHFIFNTIAADVTSDVGEGGTPVVDELAKITDTPLHCGTRHSGNSCQFAI